MHLHRFSGPLPVPSSHAVFLLVCFGLLLLLASPIRGQAPGDVVELKVEENVRSEPNGTIIARLQPGARGEVLERIDGWTRVRISGFVWIESLVARDEGSFDLRVVAEDGENLRSEPSGTILGRLMNGTLLSEVGREPGWVEVERVAWIWTPSIRVYQEGARPAVEAAPEEEGSDEGVVPEDTPAAEVPLEDIEGESWLPLAGGQGLFNRPDGDSFAALTGPAEVRVMERSGSWARVRVEGWVRVGDSNDPVEADRDGPLIRGLSPAQIAAGGDRYRGALVELDLQFISVEVAEAIRTDFQEGERFLLTRSTESARRFVYVAIDDEQFEEARALTPLERITVQGRVRVGAAVHTGNPVLQLVSLQIVP